MNGDANRRHASLPGLAPAYSLLRDVDGGKAASNQQPVGRYTAISKSVVKSNGGPGVVRGSYHPASHSSVAEQTRRPAFRQPLVASSRPNGVNTGGSATQCAKQSWPTAQVNGFANGNHHNNFASFATVNGGHAPDSVGGDSNHPAKSYECQIEVGSKPQSVTTSTLVLRDYSREAIGTNGPLNNRSVGGSLSCGQPSPSSTGGEPSIDCVSPTGSARIAQSGYLNGQQVQYQPQIFAQPASLWLHQSEIHLPTGVDSDSTRWSDRAASDYYQGSCTTPRRLNGDLDLYQRDKGPAGSSVGADRSTSSGQQYNSCHFNGDGISCERIAPYYSSSSTMLYGSRNPSDDHLNNMPMGPSHRKIQTLHGTGGNQRRYPSDTNLNYTPKDRPQVYTSGNKPGPVTIPARSRSAQPSPGPSPCVSPNSLYRASESNLNQGYAFSERSSRATRPHNFDLNYSSVPGRRGTSSPPGSGKQKITAENEAESPILPSVKEIIRQVEAMTQANAATSTTDISTVGQQSTLTGTSGIPRFQRQSPGRKSLPTSDLGYSRSAAGFRQNGVGSNSSMRAPSAPQLRQYTPIQAKFNATVIPTQQSAAPPVPPHGSSPSKAVIGSFTRRFEPNAVDGSQRQRSEVCINPPSQKKIEMLSQLPMDYQKLREAFIEQRREIQRLRKQLAEKDLLLNQLQGDIRLYEPWR